MKFYQNKKFKEGQALIIATIFLLLISATVVFGLAAPTIKQIKIGNDILKSRESYFLAEAGMEDVIYRLKYAIPTQASDTLTINGNTVTTEIADTSTGKTITSLGDWGNYFRKLETKVVAGVGVSFIYGVQTGAGGFSLDNNAGVSGNVYSNGNITGSNNTYITGTAIAANSAALTTDQSNDTPTPPASSINFRNSSAAQDFAQSFRTSTSSPINKVEFYIKKTGSPANATVRIASDSGGNPSSLSFTTGTLSASSVTTNYGWVTVTFEENVYLTMDTTYWLVIDNSSNNASNYYTIGANSSYVNGSAKVGQWSGTWNNTTPTGLDGYFKVYLGGVTSIISDITVGTAGIGNAHAHTVNNVVVHGNLYCQTGSGNGDEQGGTLNCNTSLPDPVPQPYPISEGNITQWKSDAEAGGVINGNYTPTGDESTLGPKKIIGNLVLPSDHALTLTGTVWVTGNIIMPNNNAIRLSSGYGAASGILLSDGYVRLENNIDFFGSGQSTSRLLLLSTSACPLSGICGGNDAIEILNNVGSNGNEVIVYAHNGTIDFNNNAGVKGATAYQIHLSNNVIISYESGLANQNFTSGPGGAWNITSWREVE